VWLLHKHFPFVPTVLQNVPLNQPLVLESRYPRKCILAYLLYYKTNIHSPFAPPLMSADESVLMHDSCAYTFVSQLLYWSTWPIDTSSKLIFILLLFYINFWLYTMFKAKFCLYITHKFACSL